MSFVNCTTGTINVAEYNYPSGTPGVTDCFFLIMLCEVFLFCFLFPFGTCTIVVLYGGHPVYSNVFRGLADREVKVIDL